MASEMRVAPDGYSLGKRLHSSPHAEVYAGVRVADGVEVVLKAYLQDRNTDSRPRARREIEALRRVTSERVPRAIDLDRSGDGPVLVLERLPGLPLAQLLADGPLDLHTWIEVACQLAQTLSEIHAARMLHKDLSPNNVLVERQSGRTWVIDFGLASELGTAERGSALLTGTAAGTFHYISPEQTGRMNRGCDFRSDLYSLGATLYHAACGVPPFPVSDPLELIHCHMARWAPVPTTHRADLPEPISRLLLKLLRKEPDERYQSARTLLADLESCRDQLARNGRIDGDFVLASAETPERPRFSARLHGRERESALLAAAYARAVAGQTQLVLLTGEPGAGKSSLVDQLRPTIAETGGYLAPGKFDLYRDRAYGGWTAALGSLAQQLLLESDAHLARWRSELIAGLGSIARSLVDLVPDLEFVLGDLPPVPKLGSRETQARLSLGLQRFVAVSATPQHPLVLFLDDLQWSDAGSRVLLEELLSSPEPKALLVIGAYRSAEVDAHHPLASLLERLTQRGVNLERIDLGPLSVAATSLMLAEALERTPDSVQDLARLIERKTGNSPLLARQFLEHLHERGWLRYERGLGWNWDPAQIEAADVPDGAVALMTAKIERLDADARAALEFASCVSDEFDVDLLAELSGQSRATLETPLFALAQHGLIAPSPAGYRFAHDRIREAAQNRLSEDERGKLHARTASLLIERLDEEQRALRAFEIAEHLDRGLAHLPPELRITAMEINLLAGKVALAGGAAATAERYFSVARGMLAPDDWQQRRALVFELQNQSADAAVHARDHAAAFAFLDDLEQRELSRFEFAQVAARRILVLALARPPEVGARYALETLRKLGVRWPLNPSRLRTRLELRWVDWLIGSGDEAQLEPATSVDFDSFAVILVIGAAGGVLARLDVNLVTLAACHVLRYHVRHGYSAPPGYAFAAYAAYAHAVMGDVRLARRHVRHALVWNERVPNPTFGPRTEITVHLTLLPWMERRREALRPATRLAELSREVGDREFEYYARFVEACNRALAGDPVSETELKLRELAAAIQSANHLYAEPELVHGIYRLLHSGASDAQLEQRVAEMDARIAAHPSSAESYVRTIWTLVLCVYGRHDLAFEQSEAIGERLFRVVPFVHVADHTFYRGLAAAELATSSRGAARRTQRKALRTSLARLRRWAKAGPDFVHMVQLLEAESARLGRHVARARALYEQAAQRARQQEFPHHVALAHERRARMLIEMRRSTEASAALKEACALYRQWGAELKADTLAQERRKLTGES
jgi:hypothetical protein